MSIILVCGGLRQEDLEFKVSLGYTPRPCLKVGERGRHLEPQTQGEDHVIIEANF
jgi:hypothetical protein